MVRTMWTGAIEVEVGRSVKTMPDRKKVMSWLEGLAQQDWRMFHSDSEVQEIARNALELLKEQEARLLTIEEITGDGECWFEGINGACGYADCYMRTGSKEVELNRISMKPEYVSWDDFGKKWRCWSYRPTEEQRKAVKWDENP